MDLIEAIDKLNACAHESAKMTRQAALDMVNGLIVVAEDKGLETVPLSTLRLIADHIARLPLPRK